MTKEVQQNTLFQGLATTQSRSSHFEGMLEVGLLEVGKCFNPSKWGKVTGRCTWRWLCIPTDTSHVQTLMTWNKPWLNRQMLSDNGTHTVILSYQTACVYTVLIKVYIHTSCTCNSLLHTVHNSDTSITHEQIVYWIQSYTNAKHTTPTYTHTHAHPHTARTPTACTPTHIPFSSGTRGVSLPTHKMKHLGHVTTWTNVDAV